VLTFLPHCFFSFSFFFQAGYSEALTFALCSTDDAFKFMRREDDGKTAATIANPVTEEFQIVRVNLLSGLLKTISENRSVCPFRLPLPLRLYFVFESLGSRGLQ
jgi:phenylalanyl-tRNA synthetase beta chain